MFKVSINGKIYLVPRTKQEATLGFYERIHKQITQDLTEYSLVACIIGCGAELYQVAEDDYSQLAGIASTVMQWLPAWMRECSEAKPVPYRVGVEPVGFMNKFIYRHKTDKVYPMPKNWEHHTLESTALLDGWLQTPDRPTLVSDVISLYLAPSVFGQYFKEEDREALRQDLLQRPAVEVLGFFTYALKNRHTSSRPLARLIGRLLGWIYLPSSR